MIGTNQSSGSSNSESLLPDNPNKQPGFEIRTEDTTNFGYSGFDGHTTSRSVSFAPYYFPDRFRQTKEKELDREGHQFSGESVSIKTIKNREIHVRGVLLESSIPDYNELIDYNNAVTILSPVIPNGGMECIVQHGELSGKAEGYDPHAEEWLFEYMIDLVSTGKDEYDNSRNAIVSEII